MIPYRDDVPSRTLPLMTILLIVANVLVFVYQLSLPAPRLQAFIQFNGFVPARLGGLAQHPVDTVAITARSLLGSQFLHGGWLHLIGNMLYLWVFGDNVEDRMGPLRFLGFYLLCGVLAGLAHLIANPGSPVPAIGASGAVAGVLGAYLLCHPFARISTIIPLFLFWPVVELPAILVLGSWFVVQLFNGAAAIGVSAETSGVAWWAHVGGFLAGLALLGRFERLRARRHRYGTVGSDRSGGFTP